MPPPEQPSPLRNAKDQEIDDMLSRFQPVEDPNDLAGENTQVKKVAGLEKLQGNVEELTDADLEEINEEIELTGTDLEEIPSPTNGTLRSAELHMVESHEAETNLIYGLATEASIEHPKLNEDPAPDGAEHGIQFVNEDAAFYSAKRGIQFVADGMGGVPAGDKASAKAAEQLTRPGLAKAAPEVAAALLAGREQVQDKATMEHAVSSIIKQMNDEIVKSNLNDKTVKAKALAFYNENNREESEELFRIKISEQFGEMFDPNNKQHAERMEELHRYMIDNLLKSIGCTVSMSKIWRGPDNKDHLTIGNVGDSRTYLLRKGNLEKLSKDSSHVQILLDEGLITNDEDVNTPIDKQAILALEGKYPEIKSLIPTLARKEGKTITIGEIRNRVTMAAGVSEMMKKQYGIDFEPYIKTVELEDEDVILTVSDGVADNLTDSEIQAILILHSDNPLEAAKELQQAATLRSIQGKEVNPRAKKDDVTALITRYKKNGKT